MIFKIIWWFIMWPSLGGCIKHCTLSICLSVMCHLRTQNCTVVM